MVDVRNGSKTGEEEPQSSEPIDILQEKTDSSVSETAIERILRMRSAEKDLCLALANK